MEFTPQEKVPVKQEGVWDSRMKGIIAEHLPNGKGKALTLHPDDARQAHIQRTMAYQMAKRHHEKITTRLTSEKDGRLTLFIWLRD